MTRETAAAFLPLVQALAEGKTIQFNYVAFGWTDLTTAEFSFTGHPSDYRIKPEPERVPWGPLDVPAVCWVREKFSASSLASLAVTRSMPVSHLVTTIRPNGIVFGTEMIPFGVLFKGYEHSTDLTTWKPCATPP